KLDVDSIDLAAVELGLCVEPLERLADDGPLGRILELDLGRNLEFSGLLGKFAVSSGCTIRAGDDVLRSLDVGHVNTPAIGCGLHQHHARGCTAFANIFLRVADALAAIGAEIAPDALAANTLAGSDIFPADLVPVGFQFLGNKLGKTGQRALTHLDAGNADQNRVIRIDNDPGVQLLDAFGGAGSLIGAGRHPETER